jgi:magnesium chelatase family protein
VSLRLAFSDIHVEGAVVSAAYLAWPPPAEGNAAVAARVALARNIQRDRFEGKGLRINAQAEGELLDQIATPDSAGKKLLSDAADSMRLTARGYHRVLKVARTIADLAGSDGVARLHVAEALSYRRIANLQ